MYTFHKIYRKFNKKNDTHASFSVIQQMYGGFVYILGIPALSTHPRHIRARALCGSCLIEPVKFP